KARTNNASSADATHPVAVDRNTVAGSATALYAVRALVSVASASRGAAAVPVAADIVPAAVVEPAAPTDQVSAFLVFFPATFGCGAAAIVDLHAVVQPVAADQAAGVSAFPVFCLLASRSCAAVAAARVAAAQPDAAAQAAAAAASLAAAAVTVRFSV